MKVNKTMYGNNECVPDKLLENFLLSNPGIKNHMNRQVVAPDLVFPQSLLGFVRLRSISQVAMYDIASSDVRIASSDV